MDFQAFSLTGPGIGKEGLTVAVFMDRTFAHVCYARPAENIQVGRRRVKSRIKDWLY